MISCFGIKGGWQILKKVSDKIGGGLPDLSQTYQNLSDRRHKAAHAVNYSYSYQDLQSTHNDILAISSSLDILLTARHRQVESDLSKKVEDHSIESALGFRFLEQSDTFYRETTTIGGRARKKWATLDGHLKPMLKLKQEFLIVLNQSKRIHDWHS